jgi:hypothetical protein
VVEEDAKLFRRIRSKQVSKTCFSLGDTRASGSSILSDSGSFVATVKSTVKSILVLVLLEEVVAWVSDDDDDKDSIVASSSVTSVLQEEEVRLLTMALLVGAA